jgi:hypothetical protein
MQTLYLHIGRGKTGTSALQKTLSKSRSALFQQGIKYLKAGDNGGGHLQFARSFIRHSPEYGNSKNCRDQVINEIRSISSTALLSSEHFEVANVADLKEFFSRHLPHVAVKIIYFVRSQDELAESQYNQMVKVGREFRSFDDFITDKLEGFDFAAVADLWATHFGESNIICRVYDARSSIDEQFLACLSGSNASDLRLRSNNKIDRLIEYFARIRTAKNMGDLLSLLTLPRERSGNKENESIDYRALMKARELNSLNAEQQKKLGTRSFSRDSKSDFPALFFDSATAREFRDRFSESNRRLTRKYLGNETADLGGRRYSDETRDAFRRQIDEYDVPDAACIIKNKLHNINQPNW